MPYTNKIAPKINPYQMVSAQTGAAVAANRFVKNGASKLLVVEVAAARNEPAVGFLDSPWPINHWVSLLVDENQAEVIADGDLLRGEEVVTGAAVGEVCNIATLAPADNAVLNIVGTVLMDALDGETVPIKLKFTQRRY